ncbi:uncharacterized protein LOC115881203 [Sitophilus oryzae]|uniref:Uncharacterized protein LOC115881203 n=1 Tax=Sitophilus oryzae TaxID=7048 RepID=A0A6J2XSL5_SITOR|nr:uncharacterized protein LOC115881203 [Sitophilus oryzae]
MTLRYPIGHNKFVTVISVYAPTLKADPEITDAFYQSLEEVLNKTPIQDRLILMGDFNARVGREHNIWEKVIGKHGIGNMNANGELLLTKCSEHGLTITNTLFMHNDKFKGTWQHPRSKHWHQLDHVIVRQRDLKEVLDTKARVDVECWTDHRILISKMVITVRPKYSCIKKPSKRKVINTAKLADPNIRSELGLRISETLTRATDTDSDDPEHIWINIRDAIQSECEKTLGETVRCNKDWFRDKAEEIESALELKRKAHTGLVNNPECRQAQKHFTTAKHEAQKTIRAAKNSWWKSKANEIQTYADNNDSRRFFQALRELYGPVNRSSLIRDVNGELLKDETEIRHRWKEHFSLVLNQNSNIDQEVYDLLPQYDTANFLSIPLAREEIADAIASLKNNKAPGKDSIPAEIYKALTPELMPHLENLFTVIWEQESVPQDFRDSIIISLYKNKGDKT